MRTRRAASENFFAEYTGSGVLNVFTHNEPGAVADAYFEIFPLLDWHELGGVTAEADTPIPQCGAATGGTWPITYLPHTCQPENMAWDTIREHHNSHVGVSRGGPARRAGARGPGTSPVAR